MSEPLLDRSDEVSIRRDKASSAGWGILPCQEDPLPKRNCPELADNNDDLLVDSGLFSLPLVAELKRALKRLEFRVVFQPICSLNTRRIVGFEALVRWQHPNRGLLSPADFLQLTEDTGLIIPIGQWVLREACQQMHQWHLRFPNNPPLYLSVNISSKQFQQPDLVEQISRILQETGLNPASLKLEITETLVMQNSESARYILLQLRALNVKLAIDDFGTGYSSLSYLQKFPVHTLKIDHSFISKLQDAKESLEIVRAVVTLAHNLGLDVVAEGVETANHVATLKILKCEFAQGNFYSDPVDTRRAEELIVKDIQSQCGTGADAGKGTNDASMGQLPGGEHAKSIRDYIDNRDHEALKMIMADALLERQNIGTGTHPSQGGQSQEQKLREEFDIHIEDLKREATKQFDEGLYTRCIGTFQFLCELEPDNRDLRDYLELSKQLVYEEATIGETSSAKVNAKVSTDEDLLITDNSGPNEGRSGQASAVTPVGKGNLHQPRNRDSDQKSNASLNKRHLASLAAGTAFILIVAVGSSTLRHSQSPLQNVERDESKANQQTLPAELKATPRADQRGDLHSVARLDNSTKTTKRSKTEAADIRIVEPSKKQLPTASATTSTVSKNLTGRTQPAVFTYPLIHEHILGSCQGNLRINSRSVAFEPSSHAGHAFEFKLTEILGTEKGDSLKIKFKRGTYRFKAKIARNQNLSKLAEIDSRLNRARAEVEVAKTSAQATTLGGSL